jgi:putative MATE family efflux protein
MSSEPPIQAAGHPASQAPPSGMRDVWRLAWPAVLSFVLNSSYRINDQFWIQGLGREAQAAIAACTFVLIMNFAVIYLVAGGTLPLIAHAVGAGDRAQRDTVMRHSLLASGIVAALLGAAGWVASPWIVQLLGLEEGTALQAQAYLRIIYLGMLPLALAPVLDSVFIGIGNTLAPMALQVLAVATNFTLNPLLIYGVGDFAGLGIEGAAIATVLSRALSVSIGLALLVALYRMRLIGARGPRRALLAHLARIGAPVSLSIATYAGVYWLLFIFVLGELGAAVQAGLGIGFNAFEGLSFPFYLGVAVAGASLVGRNLGAGSEEGALAAARNSRRLGRVCGLLFAFLFWFAGPHVVPLFSVDPGVVREATQYVLILALSQLFVAEEATSEKILAGSGWTRPIFRVSLIGNGLRVPMAYLFAFTFGWGAAGVWWAINLTTYLKAGLLYREVARRDWLRSGRRAERSAGG